MKKYLFISLIILSGCSQNIGNLSIVSTRPTNISNEYESIGLIQGESTIFASSADKMPRINDPIQNALNISGADLITNASFELETYLFFKIIKVTGEGWVLKKDDNVIETQRKNKILEYDPETGEPIYE
jgi:hypothetical protein